MPKRKFAMGQECHDLLNWAIEKHVPVTITTRNSDSEEWHVYKAQMLDTHDRRLFLSEPVPDTGSSPLEGAVGQEIAVTFKKGYNKCLFVSRLAGRKNITLDSGTDVSTLACYRPEQLEKIQRRAFNRAEPPADQTVIVTFRLIEGDDKKSVYQGELANLSAGGLGVYTNASCIPPLQEDQQVYMQFVPLPGQEPICVEARFRHATVDKDKGKAILGFQILGLEVNEQSRATMRRIGRIVQLYERRKPIADQNLTFSNRRR